MLDSAEILFYRVLGETLCPTEFFSRLRAAKKSLFKGG
jgi:hypothetical protein